jgi:predicted secreted protein
MNKFLFITIALTIFSIIICNTNNDEFRLIKLSDLSDENSYIPVKAGQKFTLELEGNPTTGYQWFVHNKLLLDENKTLKALNLDGYNVGEYYRKPNSGDRQMVGVGGYYHFKFEATKPGYENVTFVYKRAYSDEGEIYKNVNIHVVEDDRNEL